MRKHAKHSGGTLRIIVSAAAIAAQLFLLALIVIRLRQYSVYAYLLLEAAALVGVLVLVDRSRNSAYTTAWLIVFLIVPVFGHLLYLLWGRSGTHSKKGRKIRDILSEGSRWLLRDPAAPQALRQPYPAQARISAYLEQEGFPLYTNTACAYFPLGELQFERMLADMENAERFIFLEYFIVSEGALWDRVFRVLGKKASEGVEVRLLYDDLGSILTAPPNLIRALAGQSIRALRFNPVHRHLSRLYLNYRNHQKIAVIDGNIGYTGGANLADEYINLYEKHGHWKDTAVRLEGDAVWSLTVTFLQMWEAESGRPEDYALYRPSVQVSGDGFYQPFCDGPANHPKNPAEAAYRQMICTAQQYVYITTPYLVIDDAMMDDLCTAALSGVDVRIVTPKRWDRFYVHMVTTSNYGRLMEAGVRIYEYAPGYIHAKTILSDDRHAITGSINMDYRSFYLHFENGVWICGAPVLEDIRRDMEHTFSVCEEISLGKWMNRPRSIRLAQAFFRLFIPLL